MHGLPVKVRSQSYERGGIPCNYVALHGQKRTILPLHFRNKGIRGLDPVRA